VMASVGVDGGVVCRVFNGVIADVCELVFVIVVPIVGHIHVVFRCGHMSLLV